MSELAQLVAHLINILLNFRSDESVRTIVQTLKVCAYLPHRTCICMYCVIAESRCGVVLLK